MEETELPKEGPRKEAEFLRSSFLRARNPLRVHIEAKDGTYDIHRIREVLRGGGVRPDELDVIERAEAIRDEHLVARGSRVELTYGDPTDHYIFRQPFKRSRDCLAYVVDDAHLSFDVTTAGLPEFYVFDGQRRLINGLFFGASPFLETPRRHFDSSTVFADDFFVRFNICHLLFDKLPRYVFGRKLEPDAVGLLFAANDYTEALASIFGGHMHGLARDGRRGTVSMRRLVVFSNSFAGLAHPLQNGAPSHVGVIHDLRDAAARLGADRGLGAHGKVMIDRNASSARRLVNQDDLIPIIEGHGFSFVDAGALSPLDQMSRFASTQTLMGVHGAGLANLAFMPEGSEVLELLSQLTATRAYAEASQHLGLHYRYLVLPDPQWGWIPASNLEHDVRHNRRDVIAPPHLLAAFLG